MRAAAGPLFEWRVVRWASGGRQSSVLALGKAEHTSMWGFGHKRVGLRNTRACGASNAARRVVPSCTSGVRVQAASPALTEAAMKPHAVALVHGLGDGVCTAASRSPAKALAAADSSMGRQSILRGGAVGLGAAVLPVPPSTPTCDGGAAAHGSLHRRPSTCTPRSVAHSDAFVVRMKKRSEGGAAASAESIVEVGCGGGGGGGGEWCAAGNGGGGRGAEADAEAGAEAAAEATVLAWWRARDALCSSSTTPRSVATAMLTRIPHTRLARRASAAMWPSRLSRRPRQQIVGKPSLLYYTKKSATHVSSEEPPTRKPHSPRSVCRQCTASRERCCA